jgi:bifunctional non-homologous end joining protein LigD
LRSALVFADGVVPLASIRRSCGVAAAIAKTPAAGDRHDAARAAAAANSGFGSPLGLSRVRWVMPELVVEVKYLAWTGDNLLRQVVYEGLREDKPPADVRRELPHPNVNTPAPKKPAQSRR